MVNEIKNILLVGKTGSGKSALANVLFNSFEEDMEFQEVFKESKYAVSENKDIQTNEFEWKGANYRVIDTLGVDNTKLPEKEVLEKLKKGIGSVEGISQIFFLVRHRSFTEEEKKLFKLLENIVRDNISKCVTIVRTEFPSFEDENEREKDSKLLIEEIKKVSNSFTSCKVIHIDNPSLFGFGRSTELAKETRKISRIKLLGHLQDNCLKNYKLDSNNEENKTQTQITEIEDQKPFKIWLRKYCLIS